MGCSKILFCRKCGTLDYAKGRCSKCSSAELDEADIDFMAYGSSVIQSPEIPVLLTRNHPIEKIGWNGSNKIIRKH